MQKILQLYAKYEPLCTLAWRPANSPVLDVKCPYDSAFALYWSVFGTTLVPAQSLELEMLSAWTTATAFPRVSAHVAEHRIANGLASGRARYGYSGLCLAECIGWSRSETAGGTV